MNCPNDGAALETRALGEVQVDECPACQGVWFDEGELEKAKNAADPDLRWMEIELWKDPDRYSLGLSDLVCPRDGQPLVAITYGEGGVVVDHCVKCRGIWLDRGKFSRIVTALEGELLSKHSDEYFRETLAEAGEVVAGEKGFASGWRDFLTVARLMQYRILAENPKLREALVAYVRSTPLK